MSILVRISLFAIRAKAPAASQLQERPQRLRWRYQPSKIFLQLEVPRRLVNQLYGQVMISAIDYMPTPHSPDRGCAG